jgi:protein phosphatase
VTGFDDIEYASLTDVGVKRSHNQDAYASMPAGDQDQWRGRGHLFVVADGMGAHAVGELASKLAADSIPHVFAKHVHEGPVVALRKAFIEANLSIHTRGQQNKEFQGMGTTATAILLRPEGAWVGHVGDSRAYRVRNGVIEQLSFDHSLVWELARRQRKDPDELEGIPSNVIVRSLGPEPLVQVDVEGPHPIRAGDYFVLCSDGLSGPVTDREIGAVVSALPPAEACRFLIHLANLQGGPDNITAIIVHVREATPGSDKKRTGSAGWENIWQKYWPFAALLLGIFLGMGAVALTYHELAGKIPTFILATLALGAGLVGLLVQTLNEKRQPVVEPQVPRLKVYKQVPCAIDRPFVLSLGQGVTDLETQVREKNWQADWPACRAQRELAARHLEDHNYLGAFRAQCQAMTILMDAVQKQRGKEESFKPLWESKPRYEGIKSINEK